MLIAGLQIFVKKQIFFRMDGKQIVLLLMIFMRKTVIPKIHGMDLLEMLESELSSQPFKELVGHIYPLEIVTYLAASKCT